MSTLAKVILSVLIFLAPYIIVGLCWCASLGGFSYQETVTNDWFYFWAIVYWAMLQWPVHMLVHED